MVNKQVRIPGTTSGEKAQQSPCDDCKENSLSRLHVKKARHMRGTCKSLARESCANSQEKIHITVLALREKFASSCVHNGKLNSIAKKLLADLKQIFYQFDENTRLLKIKLTKFLEFQ